jgi:hypothetical protein
MNFNQYIKNIESEKGVWRTIQKTRAVSYPKDGNSNFINIEDNSFWYKHRNNCIEQVIKNYSTQVIVFDVGGGNGYVSLAIKKSGSIPVIVEPDINGINNAKRRGFKNLVNAPFQDLDIIPSSIPSIGLFDVLEHIEKDSDFLNELNVSLIKKGKIYITVPAYNFLWSNEDVHDGHYRRYTRGSIVSLLEENNFTILYSSYIFRILPFPIFFLRTIPYWFNKTKKSIENESKEHSAGILDKFFNLIFTKELKIIKKKENIGFGGSLLIVAQKK